MDSIGAAPCSFLYIALHIAPKYVTDTSKQAHFTGERPIGSISDRRAGGSFNSTLKKIRESPTTQSGFYGSYGDTAVVIRSCVDARGWQ